MGSRQTQLRADQTLRRKRQAVELEHDNAKRLFLLKEAFPNLRVAITMEERLDVLLDFLHVDRAGFDLAWEQHVAKKLDKAEEEAPGYAELRQRARREAELLDGVPLDGQQTTSGLTIVGGT